MQLTFREVAGILSVPEDTVYRWIADKQLPTQVVNGQHRFSRSELYEWATRQQKDVPSSVFARIAGQPSDTVHLESALQAGGVHADLPGSDAKEVLQQIVQSLPLSSTVDRENLVTMIVAKSGLRVMAIGNGIALPRPRLPIVIPGCPPVVSLCYLAKPLPVEASDQQPIQTLFVLLSPTVRTHLQLLARLAFASRDDQFRALLARRAPAAQILSQARRIEDEFRSRGIGANGYMKGNGSLNSSANGYANGHSSTTVV